MIFNPLESGLHFMIHKKKEISSRFFESLARLAYNKGTALFRGNDPLQRSAAETFSLIINTSSDTPNMLDMAQTGMETETWQSHSCTVHAHGRTHQPGGALFFYFLQKRVFVLSAYTLTEGYMRF